MKLYELTEDLLKLQALLEDSDEEPSQALLDTIDASAMDFADKAEGYAKVIRALQAQSDAIAAEAKRMLDRARSLEKRAAWLKSQLLQAMIATSTEKVKGSYFTISRRLSPGSLVINDEKALPPHFLIVSTSANKSAIKAALAAGQDVPGCSIAKSETLTIR